MNNTTLIASLKGMRYLVLAFLLITTVSSSYGCTCDDDNSFCAIYQQGDWSLALVEIISIDSSQAGIAILWDYNNDFEKDTVHLWMQNGFNCTDWINGKVGDTALIMAYQLDEPDTFGFSYSYIGRYEIGDYSLGSCGTYSLSYRHGRIQMPVSDYGIIPVKPEEIQQYLSICVKEIEVSLSYHRYLSKYWSLWYKEGPKELKLRIFNILGQIIYESEISEYEKEYLDLSVYGRGVYVVTLSDEKKMIYSGKITISN